MRDARPSTKAKKAFLGMGANEGVWECGKGEKRGRRNEAARVSPAEAALDSTCTDTRQQAPYCNKQMI